MAIFFPERQKNHGHRAKPSQTENVLFKAINQEISQLWGYEIPLLYIHTKRL